MFIKQCTGRERIIIKAEQPLALERDQSFKGSEEWRVPRMPSDVFCFIPGDDSTFSVSIDETELVDNLKKKIKAEMGQELEHVAVATLALYHINIKFDESDEHITQANEIFQDLSKHKQLKLNEWHVLSEIEKGFPKGFLHILVQLPPSESIHSRACGAVALMFVNSMRRSTLVVINRSQAESPNGSDQRFGIYRSEFDLSRA